MNIHQAILHGENILRVHHIDQPRWNAERLLILALNQPRTYLYTNLNTELTQEQFSSFSKWLEQRSRHFPLAYLEGTQEFFGREFFVNESVLIPRPETEEIIRAALELPLPKNPRVLDVGSGSGAIAITIALEIPASFVVALDISDAALKVLQKNASGKVHLLHGDFSNMPFRPNIFDIVTANLPYVEEHEFAGLPEETKWEPRIALETTSLEHTYGQCMQQAALALKVGGFLILEIGSGQRGRIKKVSSQQNFRLVSIRKDWQGIDRVMVLQKL
jgi:release factor glutamine methyltransferase